jgi:hypothetical protein
MARRNLTDYAMLDGWRCAGVSTKLEIASTEREL